MTGVNTSFEVTSINAGVDKDVHVGGPTDLELALYAMLEEYDIEFTPEWTVPGLPYRIDAFAPSVLARSGMVGSGMVRRGEVRQGEARIGFEADGPWHDAKHDRRRDRLILETGHIDKIVRLTYKDLKPWM